MNLKGTFFLLPPSSLPQEMCELIPSDQEHLLARKDRRDQLLMGLAKLKKEKDKAFSETKQSSCWEIVKKKTSV